MRVLFLAAALLLCGKANALTGQAFLESYRINQIPALAYINAVNDYNGLLKQINSKHGLSYINYCMPQNANLEQAMAIVVKFLKDNPQEWNYPAYLSAVVALEAAWPCN